jgi:glycosyltransferase involved in cell wall biosynthesis
MKDLRPPRISIVTPSYNQGTFIRETIESVLQQGYPNFEYWVIDGGSTDNTVDILRSYEPRISWISEKDRGQAHAINKGLQRISGDIITFINSDDLYLSDTFFQISRCFSEHPNVMWLTGDYSIIDGYGKTIQSYVTAYKKMLRKRPTFRRLAIVNYIAQSSTFWRRELLEEVGLFEESFRYCFDYDFWLKTMEKHPLHVIDHRLSLFRVHRASKGGSEFSEQFEEEHEVLSRYTSSKCLLGLHRLHAALVVFAYHILKR